MRATHPLRRVRALTRSRLRLESLEDRQCLSVTVSTVALPGGTELRILGDDADDTINIADQGDGHVDVTDEGGNPLGGADDVIRILLMSGGGGDDVNYALGGPLTNSQTLLFRLGTGNDTAELDFTPGVTDARLGVDVDGGFDEDVISALVGPLTNAMVDLNLRGGFGNDGLSAVSATPLPPASIASHVGPNGHGGPHTGLRIGMDGGFGDDTLAADLVIAADSRSSVRMNGNAGDDNVSLVVMGAGAPENNALAYGLPNGPEVASPGGLYADLVGGSGDDTLGATLAGGVAEHANVEMDGGSGDDELSLVVAGVVVDPTVATASLSHPIPPPHGDAGLYADLYGGPGDDSLVATIGALPPGRTHLDLDGGSGDDTMSFDATNVAIAAGSSLYAKLYGGSGDDEITGTYSGQILGVLKYQAYGGSGDDTLVSNLTAAIGSTGSLYAASAGGAGADDVTLNVFDNSGDGGPSLLAALHAVIFDPGGHDTLTHTDNVQVILNFSHAARLAWFFSMFDRFDLF